MSKAAGLVGPVAGDQARIFVKRMAEIGMIPIVVLGFGVQECAGVDHIRVGSVWADRFEESSSDAERKEVERLLSELSELIAGWIEHDRERLD